MGSSVSRVQVEYYDYKSKKTNIYEEETVVDFFPGIQIEVCAADGWSFINDYVSLSIVYVYSFRCLRETYASREL